MIELKDLTPEQRKRLYEFIDEAIFLSEEENAAIEHQIPMTQELFEQLTGHCVDIDAQYRLISLLKEYPHFADEYVRKIEAEIAKKDFPEMTQEQSDRLWKRICDGIKKREKYQKLS